jgi:Fe2+ transport system protein B
MATALGITYQELAKGAIASQERFLATNTLLSRGLNLDEKQMEFITNIASMENGEMVIKLPEDIAKKIGAPVNIALDELTEKQKEGILQYQKEIEKMNTATIAENQLTYTQKISNNVEAIAQYFRIRGANAVRGGAEGLVGKPLENVNEIVKEKVTEVRGKINNVDDRTKVKQEVIEFKERPLEKSVEYGKDLIEKLYDKILGSVDTNKNKTMTINFGSTPPIMDALSREMFRNPDKWKVGYDDNGYLSPQNIT